VKLKILDDDNDEFKRYERYKPILSDETSNERINKDIGME